MKLPWDAFEKSIMLLVLAEDIIKKRRDIEQLCGYPEDYGNDHLLIRAISKHLKSSEIKPIVDIVTKVIELKKLKLKTEENNDNL